MSKDSSFFSLLYLWQHLWWALSPLTTAPRWFSSAGSAVQASQEIFSWPSAVAPDKDIEVAINCHQDSNPSLGIFFVKTSIFSDLLWIDSADTVKVCRTWSGLNSPKINFCAGTSWIKHRVSTCITPEVVASSHGLIDSERPVGSCCGSSWSSVLIRVFLSGSLSIFQVKFS